MNIAKQCTVALAIASFALTGCAVDGNDDGFSSESATEGGEMYAMDELATSGPTYEAGTMLVTTANLNLREQANTNARVLRVMPHGSTVLVRQTSGDNGWIAISYGNYSGWGHTAYLAPTTGTGDANANISPDYSVDRGGRLASTALRVRGKPLAGMCALGTSDSVVMSRIIPSGVTWRRNHAWPLVNGMSNDQAYQRSVKFTERNIPVASLPQGSLIGFRPGTCGSNRTYGHVEIVTRSNNLCCSDGCRPCIPCEPTKKFIPTL